MANVRRAVQQMATTANSPEDRTVFVTSSHGSGDGKGNSYLCLLADRAGGADPHEREGRYLDRCLAADLGAGGTNKAHVFVFIDACFSGGLIEEMVEAVAHVAGTTTCTQKGYIRPGEDQRRRPRGAIGYDNAATRSGAWTDMFLTQGLKPRIGGGDVDLVQLFLESRSRYTRIYPSHGDWPCFFGRDAAGTFNTNDHPTETSQLPIGRFLCNDWLARK